MDIELMSIGLSQAKVQQQASLSVMKMAMDNAKMSGNMLTEMASVSTRQMEQSVQPNLGTSIDIKL